MIGFLEENIRNLALLFICAVLGSCASAASSKIVGQVAPPVQFTMLDGTIRSLDEFRGKNVVVVFWATSCNVSQPVLADLDTLVEKDGKRKNVVVIAVSVDKADAVEKVKDRVTYSGISRLLHSFSGNDIYDQAYIAFDVGSLPSVFVVDPSGLVLAGGSGIGVVNDTLGE